MTSTSSRTTGPTHPITVRDVRTTIVEIPFDDGGRGEGITPTAWRSLEILLVRIEDEDGVVGWGEGFGYFTVDATRALVDRLIAPVLVGTTVSDIGAWNLETQRRLHLFGRFGVTIFALSGVDIALWDLAAKRAGLPLHHLLRSETTPPPAASPKVAFYASLVRYDEPEVVADMSRRAVAHGFRAIKLHEHGSEAIAAARAAVGPDVPIAVDVNCGLSMAEAGALVPELRSLGVRWLEEPVFPPEDFEALRRLRVLGLPIAAGENWCTAEQFAAPLSGHAVDLAQPSVTKVGGVSEFLRVADLAARTGVGLLPHSPYFGPGYFASLQLAAARPEVLELEYHFVEPDAWLAAPGTPDANGALPVPDGPGLGFEPDEAVLARYARAPR